MSTLPVPFQGSHVEAFCSSGSSPGGSVLIGTLDVVIDVERRGPTPVCLRYEVVGPPSAPAFVILGGISAGRHLCPNPADPTPGWWPGVVGVGQALDPTRHRLVSLDWLGGTESEWPDATPVTPADQARGVAALLDHLAIAQASLVGASYGGMVGLAFSALFPHRTVRSVVLCAAHRGHPMATALRSIQRDIVRLAAGTPRETEALVLARALAMTTYRSPAEFENRFDWADDAPPGVAPRFPVEAYLRQRGRAFARRFRARAFLRLSESIDLHGVDVGAVTPETTLVSVDSDALAPPWLVEELFRAAPGARAHVRLRSPFGHDAFLKEAGAVCAVIDDVLAREVDR